VTGRHRGPKRKLPVGYYRAPSLQRTSCCDAFLSSSVFEVRASSSFPRLPLC